MKIAVIGSGVAGLTAGAVLVQAGHEVTVFEAYHRPGGVTASFERDGYKWDLGQLIVEGYGPGEPCGRILADLGVADQLNLRKEDRGYVFPDFELRKPAEPGAPTWRMQRLKEIFPAQSAGLDRYWKDYLRFTRLMTIARQLDLVTGWDKLATQARLYTALAPFLTRLNWSAQKLMDSYFSDEKLKAVFISILADFFTPPSRFTGLGVFALNAEATFDNRLPAELEPGCVQLYQYSILGGVSTLVDALVARILMGGGKVLASRPIGQIRVENGHVSGVADTDGNFFPAQAVVATGAAKETFLKLVGEPNLPPEFAARVKGLPLIDSIFMVHLGLDYDPSPHLHGPVTYFYGTYDIEGGIETAHQGLYHEGRDGFVVHQPTLHSPEMAPEGHHALTIYTICPDKLKDGSWAEKKQQYADKLVEYAEQRIPGLKEHTMVRAILTPEDFRSRTFVEHHAFGGLAPLMDAKKITFKTPIAGLWYAGAQSESGGGVAAVMQGAYKMAKSVR